MSSDLTLTLTRSFNAPVEAVWNAWTDPAVLPRWFGPDGITCQTHAIDIRPGGEWRFTMLGAGMSWENRHRYRELTPPGRIAFTMDDGAGNDPVEVVVTLTPEGAGTRLTQVMTFATAGSHEAARKMGAEGYGQQTLAKLAALVEAQAA